MKKEQFLRSGVSNFCYRKVKEAKSKGESMKWAQMERAGGTMTIEAFLRHLEAGHWDPQPSTLGLTEGRSKRLGKASLADLYRELLLVLMRCEDGPEEALDGVGKVRVGVYSGKAHVLKKDKGVEIDVLDFDVDGVPKHRRTMYKGDSCVWQTYEAYEEFDE